MAEVLSMPIQTDSTSHFGSTPLHRSPSPNSYFLPRSTTYSDVSPSQSPTSTYPPGFIPKIQASTPSSAPSSPTSSRIDFSRQSSYSSTPSSSISFDEDCDYEDHILFPSYHDGGSYTTDQESKFTLNPETLTSDPPFPTAVSTPPSSSPSRPVASDSSPVGGDDTAIRLEPSRHVDYLSHDWKEEDIWSSWRHIVAKRKFYLNSARLENASWRSWTKSKYRLKTVSPDTLNWMKDHDVTWLYGPLQTSTTTLRVSDCMPVSNGLSRIHSFPTKKPILKKRSLSEVILQRSISSSTLIYRAIASLRAQKPRQESHDRSIMDERNLLEYAVSSSSTTPTDTGTTDPLSALPSSSSSGISTPCEKRRIHFNNEVEQCIAINKHGDEHDDSCAAIHDDDDDASDDDGIIMMKAEHGKERKLSKKSTPRNSFSNDSKTIAMLPSTTLKYRGDTPEPAKQEARQRYSFWNVAAKLAPSPSQETLKPSRPFKNFLVEDDDEADFNWQSSPTPSPPNLPKSSKTSNFLLEDDDDEADIDWQPHAGRRDSYFIHQNRMNNASSVEEDNDLEGKGLRRTPSGMFMPYEEDEDDMVATGLFGEVVNAVNTAKDIAHVIWNVGWRK